MPLPVRNDCTVSWRTVQTGTQRRHSTLEGMCQTVLGIQLATLVVMLVLAVVVAVGEAQLSSSSKRGTNEKGEGIDSSTFKCENHFLVFLKGIKPKTPVTKFCRSLM